jgi:hypothetical protein
MAVYLLLEFACRLFWNCYYDSKARGVGVLVPGGGFQRLCLLAFEARVM